MIVSLGKALLVMTAGWAMEGTLPPNRSAELTTGQSADMVKGSRSRPAGWDCSSYRRSGPAETRR